MVGFVVARVISNSSLASISLEIFIFMDIIGLCVLVLVVELGMLTCLH